MVSIIPIGGTERAVPTLQMLLAKKEVAKLPAKLRKQQPWVRSVEPVQELLNTRQ